MFCLKPLAGLCLHSLAKKHLRSGKSSIWGLRRVFDCRGGCHPHPHPCLCSSVQLQVLLLYKLVLIRQPSHFCQEPSAGHIPNWVEEEFLAFFHCLPRVLNSSRMKKKQKKTRKASFISDVWNQYVIYLTLQGMKRKKKKKKEGSGANKKCTWGITNSPLTVRPVLFYLWPCLLTVWTQCHPHTSEQCKYQFCLVNKEEQCGCLHEHCHLASTAQMWSLHS